MNQGNSPRGDTFASSECTHAFGAAARDGHGTAGGVGKVALHRVLHGNELRPVKHDRQVDVPGCQPAARTASAARRNSSIESAPFSAGSVSGNIWPISPSPAAPRSRRSRHARRCRRRCSPPGHARPQADPTEDQRPVGVVGVGVDVEGLTDAERWRCGGISHELSPNRSSAI